MSKRSSSPHLTRCNGHHRPVLLEPLSARLIRLRIARGYSVYELATAAGVLACTIQRLESAKPADKRVLPVLSAILGVPVCQLVWGNINRIERACVRPPPSGTKSSVARHETVTSGENRAMTLFAYIAKLWNRLINKPSGVPEPIPEYEDLTYDKVTQPRV